LKAISLVYILFYLIYERLQFIDRVEYNDSVFNDSLCVTKPWNLFTWRRAGTTQNVVDNVASPR